jgi:Kef-type K+ transport system membrane component KefB
VALIVVFIAAMLGVVRPLLAPVGRRARRRAHAARAGGREILTPQLFVGVLIVALLAGWASHALGISVVVGGFLAGLAMPAREPLRRDVAAELFQLTTIVLFPVFLAVSGLNTDFTTLSSASLGGLGLLLVAGVVAKWPAGAALARAGGLSWRDGNAVGVLLNCRGPLPLVASLMGLQAGVISPVLQVGVVVMALLTTAMTGPLLDRLGVGGPGGEPADAAPRRRRRAAAGVAAGDRRGDLAAPAGKVSGWPAATAPSRRARRTPTPCRPWSWPHRRRWCLPPQPTTTSAWSRCR